MLVAFEEDGEICTIPYSKILKDQVLLDWFCTQPLSFSSFTYRENVCHGSILQAYSISTTRVYRVHACTAYYTRVQHTTRVYTHGVMPRVLLCKLCACVTRVFCVCHACLLRVSRVSSACGTRVFCVWHACNTHGLFKLWVICTVRTYLHTMLLLTGLAFFYTQSVFVFHFSKHQRSTGHHMYFLRFITYMYVRIVRSTRYCKTKL